jgi:hypothetical protein
VRDHLGEEKEGKGRFEEKWPDMDRCENLKGLKLRACKVRNVEELRPIDKLNHIF